MKITTSLPLFIVDGVKKPKPVHINLNNYRNWHYQKNNSIKKKYSSIVHNKLQKYKNINLKKIKLTLTLIRGDKRKIDRSNPLCIHEKFFCDAIVSLGIIKDDNDKVILSTTYNSGEIDKLNPRVDIVIEEIP